MAREYSIVFNNINIPVTNPFTAIQLKCSTLNIAKLKRAQASQNQATTSAFVRISIVRKSAAATVTAFTPLQYDTGDAAAKSVGSVSGTGINATVEGTNTDVIDVQSVNVLTPYLWIPKPEEEIIVPPSGIVGLVFPGGGGSNTWTCTLVFEELGG